MTGAVIGGVQATEDGSLGSRAQNAAFGAVEGAVGGAAFHLTAEAAKVGFKLGSRGVTKLYDLHRARRFNKYIDAVNFNSEEKLISHFVKHSKDFKGIYFNCQEYLEAARDVMRHGYKVEYRYNPSTMPHIYEMRDAYIKFMGNTDRRSLLEIINNIPRIKKNLSEGTMKFEFVTTNLQGDITTYHIKSAEDLFKKINSNKHIKEINPQPKVKPK